MWDDRSIYQDKYRNIDQFIRIFVVKLWKNYLNFHKYSCIKIEIGKVSSLLRNKIRFSILESLSELESVLSFVISLLPRFREHVSMSFRYPHPYASYSIRRKNIGRFNSPVFCPFTSQSHSFNVYYNVSRTNYYY